MADHIIITISRQYGSGGRSIGTKLGEMLGIPVYDHELITHAAEKGNISSDVATRANESATSSLLYTLALGSTSFGLMHHPGYNMNINDRLYVLQSNLIKKLADEGSCIIIGRCGDYVLRERKNCMKVFIYGDTDARVELVSERHALSRNAALDLIAKTDKRRASYYSFYTGRKWGKYDNYDLAMSSTSLGIDGTAELLAQYAKIFSSVKE